MTLAKAIQGVLNATKQIDELRSKRNSWTRNDEYNFKALEEYRDKEYRLLCKELGPATVSYIFTDRADLAPWYR